MTLNPATFYDDNGVVRLQGQLEAASGSPSIQVLGPFTVAFDTPGASLVLWSPKAGDLVLDLVVMTTVTWDSGMQLEIYCSVGGTDFLNPRRNSGDLQVTQDAGRIFISKASEKAYFGVNEDGTHSTPSLIRADCDVICDVIGVGVAGEAKIWAQVFPA